MYQFGWAGCEKFVRTPICGILGLLPIQYAPQHELSWLLFASSIESADLFGLLLL
jgi:hypothetical protein